MVTGATCHRFPHPYLALSDLLGSTLPSSNDPNHRLVSIHTTPCVPVCRALECVLSSHLPASSTKHSTLSIPPKAHHLRVAFAGDPWLRGVPSSPPAEAPVFHIP